MDKRRANPYIFFGGLATGGALCFAAVAYAYVGLSALASCGLGVTIAGFMVMGLDKYLAGSSVLRVPELVLFAVALCGGGAGVLLGMHFFRHKTKKASFQCLLALIFFAQFVLAASLGLELRNQ